MDYPTEDSYILDTLDRLTSNPSSFSGMLEYIQKREPKQWMSLVEILMKISPHEHSAASSLGYKLEELKDNYALYMASEPEI